MKANKLTQLLLAGFLALSCAKERPVKEIRMQDYEWQKKDFFTGHWLGRVTVVDQSSNGGFAFVGLQSGERLGHFEFTEKKLKMYDSIDIRTTEVNTAPTLINEWDISHVDKMLDESDGKTTTREVLDNKKHWKEKRFFKIDFSKSNFSLATAFPYQVGVGALYSCFVKKSAHLESEVITKEDGYFSFITVVDYEISPSCGAGMSRGFDADYTYTVKYKHSFMKYEQNTSYKAIAYTGEDDPLMQKYGYFQTVLKEYDEKFGRKNTILMNRWDPEKEHNYYFTKDFPEKWKWIFNDPEKGIFAKTNKLFKDAGLKVRFHVRENTYGDGKTKELGDIRYSFINIVEDVDGGAPFGYGPSSADPFTGEIISGNITLWTGYLQYYLERIKNTLDAQTNMFDSTLFKKMKDFLGDSKPETWGKYLDTKNSSKMDTLSTFQSMLTKNTFGYPYWNSFTSKEGGDKVFENVHHTDAFKDLMGDLNKTNTHVEDLMVIDGKDIVDTHLEKEHEHHHGHTGADCTYNVNHVISQALVLARKGLSDDEILGTVMYRTAIHELGHTLNLRHNFYGSIDRHNFSKIKTKDENGKDIEIEGMTSSVMDYLGLVDEIDLVRDWEAYDKAALLYAYSDGKIDSEKKLMFCTDEHRALNAMCNTFDIGTSPSAVLMSKIISYDNMYDVVNRRYGRPFWNTRGYAGRVFGTMFDVKKFYVMWKNIFTDGKIDKEFEKKGLSVHEVKEIKRNISKDFEWATKLSLAFYTAVVQQSATERPFRSEINNWNGATERIGILFDKVFATRFLVGDESFMMDTNIPYYNPTYAEQRADENLGSFVEKAFKSTLSSDVAMEPWFLSYATTLYGISASNDFEMGSGKDDMINKLRILKFTPQKLQEYFDVSVASIEKIKKFTVATENHPVFTKGTDVGVVEHAGNYYMIDIQRSEYAASLFNDLYKNVNERDNDFTVNADIKDIVDLYNIYKYFMD